MHKQSVVHGMREVVTGGRTAGGKRRARSASTAARSKSSGQGFAALTGRSSLYRVGGRQLRRTGSGNGNGRRRRRSVSASPGASFACASSLVSPLKSRQGGETKWAGQPGSWYCG